MWVNAQVFMELVQRIERMDAEHKAEVRQLKEDIETLKRRPLILEGLNDKNDSSDEMAKLYHEMTDGVKDSRVGRVILTDGRD